MEGALYYVYLLESLDDPTKRYVGMTVDLKARLDEHNAGKSTHTSKYRPWRLVTYIAFTDRGQAEAFERYLKSGSGHAFAPQTVVVTLTGTFRWSRHALDPSAICAGPCRNAYRRNAD